MARNVQLGHASGAGRGKNGGPGDQSGREVKVSNWYSSNGYGGWFTLIRCNDKSITKFVADADVKLCNSVI